MKFIVGIGNPGDLYDGTRHNVGMAALENIRAYFSSDRGKVLWRLEKKCHAMIATINEAQALVKPLTFVNGTGASVEALQSAFKVPSKNFLIVCDDVNLRLGKLRLRDRGSAGGHHGLESIALALQSEGYSRLRIGVGSESMPKDLTSFVLGKFSSEEEKQINGLLEKVVLVCEMWLNKGFDAAKDRLSHLLSVKSKLRSVRMRNYEGVMIVEPELSLESAKAVIAQIEELIGKHGGRVDGRLEWGKRRLAYKIKKKHEGNYFILNFQLDPKFLKKIEHTLKLNDQLLRFMIINKDDK